jgi:hypothetical protein
VVRPARGDSRAFGRFLLSAAHQLLDDPADDAGRELVHEGEDEAL